MESRRFFFWSLISLLTGLGVCNLCPSSDAESVLQANSVYTYRFRSEALAQAVGTTEDHGKIVLECDVQVAHERSCYYHLNLHNCVVTAAGGEPGSESSWIDNQPLPDLSKYPISFALSNGDIEEVAVHDEDPLYYVNIKRGVLSAFAFKLSQTEKEMRENHSDIHGICPLTSIPVEEAEGTVKTSKDMLLCNFPSRPDWQFSPWSLFWNMSFIQHVINSTTDCEYKIKEEKIIEKVFCKERHAIMLESTHRTTTAVQTNIFYYLDFVKVEAETSESPLPTLTRKTNIWFEYEHTLVPESSPPNFLTVAKKMLSDLVLDSLDEIRLFTIPQFTDFVGWIRKANNDQLLVFVNDVKGCSFLPEGVVCDQRIKDLAHSYLNDALLQCNNLPCAKTLSEMVLSDSISPTYLNFIFHSWSYMHYSKPGFITNFADICKAKNSHQCWLSLGSFVRRIHSRNSGLEGKVLEEVTEVASYIFNRISEECEVTDETDKLYTDCLVFLKAVSNMGKLYNKISPDGLTQLLELITAEDSAVVVRTSALQALKDIFDPENKEQKHLIYGGLLPLMKNSSLAASLRILSYDQLLFVSEDYNLQEHLFDILKEDTNAEVKYYVAHSINSLTTNSEFRSKRFLESLLEMLEENDLSLERIMHDTMGKSKSSTKSLSWNFPFMPEYMKGFGLHLEDSSIYDSHIYPSIFNRKAVFQLFSSFLPVTKMSSYAEGWEELIIAFEKNMADMNGDSTSFSNALMKTLAEYGQVKEESMSNFKEDITSILKKIHQAYWEHHQKLKPYANAYWDLFGSTLKYFVADPSQSLDHNQGIGKLFDAIAEKLDEGVDFNSTRIMRVVEAYHQVPTMMGLPLNWTTNATLAFSVRGGIKFQASKENLHAKGFLQPSAALTFLNRMVLDFPTLTQIGVQANSSGYTSTEFRGHYNSAKGKHTFRLERPSRTQKFLELFRSNQMIKHDKYEDIPDWDIDRTSSSWCTKDESAFGLKICLSKSYPNVTHRIKPWALMAGWCKWQFLAHPTSEFNVHYDLDLQQTSKQKKKEATAKFIVSDNEKEKSASFKAVMEENAKDVKLELKTTLLPDFSATYCRSELPGKKSVGQKVEAAFKLSDDFKYELEYLDESRIQRSSSKRSAPSDEESHTLVNEKRLNVKTPNSAYNLSQIHYKMGENSRVEASLSYESSKGESDWIKCLLPPEFWENEKRASLKVFLHYKKPIYTTQDTVTRQTEFRVQIPRHVMTLNANSLQNSDREQINVNFARLDVNQGKLDAFLNFSTDYWAKGEKWIQLVNVTVPLRSWSAAFERSAEGLNFLHQLSLKRAVMKPISDEDRDYVGWWSEEVSDRFKVEEQEIKLTSDLDILALAGEDIPTKFSSVSSEDLKGLSNSVYVSKIVLQYPFDEKIETVDFDGHFISSRGPTTFRFQKTFDMTSSYNNLKLTSHSVYRVDALTTTLYHNSFFTHLPSETKAYNTIHYVWNEKEGKCMDSEFSHEIRSHVLDLSTDATYKCESGADGLHTLRLTLNSNSSKWDMLDLNINQVIEDISPNNTKEEVTATHPLGTVHVDAEWWTTPSHHQKRVVFCSKNGDCPNAELLLEFWHRDRSFKFSRNGYEITFRNRMSPDYKKLQVELTYGHEKDGETKALDFTGEIINRNLHIWKGTVDSSGFCKVWDILVDGYNKFRSAFAEIASDNSHPLNEILQPALKMTLYDYWKSLKAQCHEFLGLSWSEIKEIFKVFEAFIEPAYSLLVNSVNAFENTFSSMYDYLKEKSVAIWAIHYFNLPHYFERCISNLPQSLTELWNKISMGEGNVLHFKYVTGKVFALGAFNEWPSLEFSPEEITSMLMKSEVRPDVTRSEKSKIAMIFGPSHVYTFDDLLYDVPKYPRSECSFLLTHDVHKSLFTVLSSEKEIHLLFPEMSITISDQNEVFINGSQNPSTLPVEASNGKVTVKRDNVLEVWSPSLSVICRSQDFLCILKLSDYHCGGVIGLLGNADGESSNDFMLPNGNTTSSLSEFLSSYEVSGEPACKKLETAPATPEPTNEEIRLCSETFREICSIRPENREKFQKACWSDVKGGHGACYATAGLSALCNLKYVAGHTECSAKKQGDIKIGKNLEVVLVVQETKYLSSSEMFSTPLKGIESLMKAIDRRFEEDGYNTIRYSLVGFGGSGVHKLPTVHSSQKNIWMDSDSMINDVLRTLEFKSREEADGLRALKYTLDELGSDSFVSKVVIIITAKDKQVADKSLMHYLQTNLEENGITLYTLSSYPSIEKGKKVFGVRADGLIFPSQAEGGEEYLDYPRGSLAKLTSSTRGSVFNSKFLKANRPSAFFAEFAQEVWAKVNKEAKNCRSCQSVRGRWWWSRSKCSIVHC